MPVQDYITAYEILKDNPLDINIIKPAKTNLSKLLITKQLSTSTKKLLKSVDNLKKEKEQLNKGLKILSTGFTAISSGIFLIVASVAIKNKITLTKLENADISKPQAHFTGTSRKTTIKNKIIDEATRQGVDPALALSLAEAESGFRQYNNNGDLLKPPRYKSDPDSPVGIFQIKPSTAKGMGYSDVTNVDQNIAAGISYLRNQLKSFNGNKNMALAAYNAGPNAVRKYKGIPPYKETQNYVNKINKSYNKYKNELSNINKKSLQQNKSSGNFAKIKDNTKYGTYTIDNPNKSRGYVLLSDRAQAYLKDVAGTGKITSGAEGLHAPGLVSHGSGNKLDVSAYNLSSNEEWANVAIPFLQNKNTAFVCFEDFSKLRFEAIQKIIYSKITPQLKKKCDTKAKYGWGDRGGCFLDYKANYGTGLHLDIGILPDSYKQTFVNKTTETIKKDITNQSKKNQELNNAASTYSSNNFSRTTNLTPSTSVTPIIPKSITPENILKNRSNKTYY